MPVRGLPLAAGVATVLSVSIAAFPSGIAADPAAIREAIAKGSAYLVEQGQADDGSFSSQAGPAITALAVSGLVKSGTPAESPAVQKAIAYLLSFKQPSGGIHPPESLVSNYETAIAMIALAACNVGGKYDADIKAAESFVKGLQWDDGEGPGPSDPAYGGAGYGKKNRPDLSNTSFLIEALRSVGTPDDDPAIQRALVFVSRTQNLEGPHNTLPFAAKNPDGGFYYTPAAGGESQAGSLPNGGLRSYGSMTYAGLKSMIFAGLSKDDPRVKAAVAWLGKNYSFEQNPGMGDAGLYYYFHTAAKALDVFGDETFSDEKGVSHVWRSELADAVIRRQQADGSWINANPRWMEGDPNLVTAYALLALSYCTQ
ncbi:MAG: prenyltransferase/squalene oxidase repeat-containing protein [Planctomycetia bacterium]